MNQRRFHITLVTILLLKPVFAQISKASPSPHQEPLAKVCAPCIRAHEEFLASDALNGRGSATHDELVAATYIASVLRQYGIKPAGDGDSYLQRVPMVRRKFAESPSLQVEGQATAEAMTLKHGTDVLFLHVGKSAVQGPLQRLEVGQKTTPQIAKGAIVMVKAPDNKVPSGQADKLFEAGAAAVLLPENQRYRSHWNVIKQSLFSEAPELADASGMNSEDQSTLIVLSTDAAKKLDDLPDGTNLKIVAAMEKPELANTWNAIGKIRGRDPELRDSAILLSAHLDHLGVGEPVKQDNIYNGADDDASGTTAVLELARVLGTGRAPRRTVIFALFGSEELGGIGSTYFREHPSIPLQNISANLEFEMIGRPDPAVPAGTLWLTGWERSNLGPIMAAHGAHLVGDPHPEQNFFARSDNFLLAQKGVVAQTISSYGMHSDYHQPSDDVAHLDFKHMDSAIGSLIAPIAWLVNSSFKPEWKPGGQP